MYYDLQKQFRFSCNMLSFYRKKSSTKYVYSRNVLLFNEKSQVHRPIGHKSFNEKSEVGHLDTNLQREVKLYIELCV